MGYSEIALNSTVVITVIALLAICVVLLAVLLIVVLSGSRKDKVIEMMQSNEREQEKARERLGTEFRNTVRQSDESVARQISQLQQSEAASMQQFRMAVSASVSQLEKQLSGDQTELRTGMMDQIDRMDKKLNEDLSQMHSAMTAEMEQIERRLETLEKANRDELANMNRTITDGMGAMRLENSRKLDEIRGTVDEKLQTTLEKRISESFRSVSEQLEQVYKGLGEMQALAGDVGSLKRVLAGVKTRGILGEIQLGSILEEILAPEQYAVNVATIPNSTERVEFAVKLPSKDGTLYLPIDSKFPGDRYEHLLQAQDTGNRELINEAYNALESAIKKEAKDIRTKYVEVPYTTNFGIMFLPCEGLYAEAVSHGLVETLQREYQINIAGPSTMAAMLNSLQMGFKTLAIQKRSSEVWKVLSEVKSEFDKFEDGFKKMQGYLNQTGSELDKLMGTRTRAIQRKLRDVQVLDETETALPLTSEDV